jgi:hypothetical protein
MWCAANDSVRFSSNHTQYNDFPFPLLQKILYLLLLFSYLEMVPFVDAIFHI